MVKKLLTISVLGMFILSACTTQKQEVQKEEPKVNIEEQKTIEDPHRVFPSCENCYNPIELNKFFKSVDYETLAKTDELIMSKIVPGLFQTQNSKLKKDVFFKSIYPIAYKVNQEIEAEKEAINNGENLEELMTKYKVDNIEDLKIRVDTLPIPMIMAQASIESAYGTSRFAEEGNALFGQWTKDPNGMTPLEKPNAIWKVARFDSPLNSARSYALNINTNPTYIKLRKLRAEGLDPINGLDKYSQTGTRYINIVKSVIKTNNLNKYK